MTLPTDEYLATIRREGEALLTAAERAPDATIAACPEWQMDDLVYHIGEVHHFWGTVVEERLSDPSTYQEPTRPAASDVVAWAHDRLDFVLDALQHAEPSIRVWTWTTQQDVAWILRRMAQETVVHRVDAELAAGIDVAIDPALASDGVDEFLEYFLSDAAVAPGSVHLHSTDASGEWLVVFGDGRPRLTREHAKGDAALRGPATDLLLALWDRQGLDALDVIGDMSAVERLESIARRS